MEKFSVLIFIFCSIFIFGQKRKYKDIPPPPSYSSSPYNKYYKPVSFGQRIKNYPFNKATKVKIVSYNLEFKRQSIIYEPPPPPSKTKEDSITLNKFYNRLQPIDFRRIIENQSTENVSQSKTLNLKEISELTHILFNTCSKYSTGISSQSGCFFPRNAILFYDENDKVFEVLEICFECDGIETYPSKFFDLENFCNYIYPELETFFIQKGLKTQCVNK